MRHLSAYEHMRLSDEARNSLARLDLYDLLDPMEREMILDRFDQFDGEIGQAELDYLVSWVVCSTRDTESQRCIYSVLDMDKATFH